jgi:pyridoxal phosphate enzyme (YggS family)
MDMIRENLMDVERRIQQACLRSGRERSAVKLIAVSKTKPASMIQEAAAAGMLDFGENKPQELRDKYELLPKNYRWHMIGNLQRNKVKYVVGRAVMIHSLGSEELAETIEKEAEKKNLVMPVLAEVNMAGESSKQGLTPGETEAFLRRISSMKHLKVMGLMTIAPMTEFPEENRVYFRDLRNLAVDIARKNIDNVNMYELSMGMTGDFEVAIEEGATMVRVGTGIFGARNYGAL